MASRHPEMVRDGAQVGPRPGTPSNRAGAAGGCAGGRPGGRCGTFEASGLGGPPATQPFAPRPGWQAPDRPRRRVQGLGLVRSRPDPAIHGYEPLTDPSRSSTARANCGREEDHLPPSSAVGPRRARRTASETVPAGAPRTSPGQAEGRIAAPHPTPLAPLPHHPAAFDELRLWRIVIEPPLPSVVGGPTTSSIEPALATQGVDQGRATRAPVADGSSSSWPVRFASQSRLGRNGLPMGARDRNNQTNRQKNNNNHKQTQTLLLLPL